MKVASKFQFLVVNEVPSGFPNSPREAKIVLLIPYACSIGFGIAYNVKEAAYYY